MWMKQRYRRATVRAQAQKLLEGYSLPAGYKISFTGEEDIQKESQEFLSKAFLIGLLIIILILVAEFNSVTQPIPDNDLRGPVMGRGVLRPYHDGIFLRGHHDRRRDHITCRSGC